MLHCTAPSLHAAQPVCKTSCWHPIFIGQTNSAEHLSRSCNHFPSSCCRWFLSKPLVMSFGTPHHDPCLLQGPGPAGEGQCSAEHRPPPPQHERFAFTICLDHRTWQNNHFSVVRIDFRTRYHKLDCVLRAQRCQGGSTRGIISSCDSPELHSLPSCALPDRPDAVRGANERMR